MILIKSKAIARLGLCTTLLVCTAVWSQSPAQGESLVIKRVAQLREEPTESSRGLLALPLQTSVVRLGPKQGAWIKVSTTDTSQATQGWVHMFDVTSPATGAATTGNVGTSALRGITNFFSRGTAQTPGTNVATSTLGIRGLGAENLNNAQPNPAAVAQAEGLRADAAQARQFASAASLTTRTVEPLPLPEVKP